MAPTLPSQEERIIKNLCDLTQKQQTELVKYVDSLQQKVHKKHDESEAKLKDAEASLASERAKVKRLNEQIGALTNEKDKLQSEKAQLLSKYEKPQDLDADQIFFAGAGIAGTDVSDEEREAYLEEKDMRNLIQIKGMGCEGCV